LMPAADLESGSRSVRVVLTCVRKFVPDIALGL
jgi:hypothetical protein